MAGSFYVKAIDNNAWLWAKVKATTWIDRIGIARKSSRYSEEFADIKTLVFFIGYPRSGHSIVGSVIDAHPNALMAHRLNALKYIESGYNEREVYYLMLRNAQRFARTGRKLTAYKYKVRNHWQGRFDKLHVIGDQEGKWTSVLLANNTELLRRLLELSDVTVKFIHVVRNPFDNITTLAWRMGKGLDQTISWYLSLCRDVSGVLAQIDPDRVQTIRHETFIQDFEPTFTRLCAFLGLPVTPGYLNDCAGIVYKKPRKSRYRIVWPTRLIKVATQGIEEFEFLNGYSYDD